jgi:hypothetical protein
MIRKPPENWQPRDEGAAVRTVRTAAAVATGGARLARGGANALRGVGCYCFAALWGFAAIMSLLAGSLPGAIGIGALAAFMVWAGNRAFARARTGFLHPPLPRDLDSDAPESFVDRASARIASEVERSRSALRDPCSQGINDGAAGKSFGQRRGVTFGQR